MPVEVTVPFATLYAFLLVLARVSGALVFARYPIAGGAPQATRVGLAVAMTLALVARWPAVDAASVTPGRLAGWALAEAAIGVALGIAVSIVVEAFTLAAQILGLQAGYAYASTIDPNSEADSGVLLVFAQLAAGLLFFTLGFDRELLRLFADSLEKVRPGAYVFGAGSAMALIHLLANLFSVALRLALPVVALLIMVDVALALLGRVNAQLQLLSLAFPAKMLVTLLMLAWMSLLFPRILRELGGLAWSAARRLLE